MLVLGRYEQQGIVIDEKIRIVVIAVEPSGLVRLGFEADKDINIRREELPPRKTQENTRCE